MNSRRYARAKSYGHSTYEVPPQAPCLAKSYMLAVTIWQPWAWAICWAEKDVENRDWHPKSYGLTRGDYIAIHASKRQPAQADWGAVLATAKAASGLTSESLPLDNVPLGAVVAVARLLGVSAAGKLSPHLAHWRTDTKYGWLLSDITPLSTAVPCRGKQKIWRLSGDPFAEVLHQWGKVA